MTWKIVQIAEADFGCEERLPGEKPRVWVKIQAENGDTKSFEIEEEILLARGLEEGSVWE